jgi:hypothetical protein
VLESIVIVKDTQGPLLGVKDRHNYLQVVSGNGTRCPLISWNDKHSTLVNCRIPFVLPTHAADTAHATGRPPCAWCLRVVGHETAQTFKQASKVEQAKSDDRLSLDV